MKRIALLLVFAAGCKTVTVVAPAAGTGAPTPKAAVERFVAAAKMQDIQAIGAAWGDAKGPMRDQIDRPQFEKRAVIMLACLRHDKATISETSPSIGGLQTAMVEFTQGKLVDAAQFTLVKGPSDRWYVQDFDIKTLQNKGHCGKA